jgi:hypothetical protein
MIPILADAMVEVTQGDQHIVIDPPVVTGALYLFLLILPILFILWIVLYKKKLQHQQILAAMEKGVPVSELMARPTNTISWVKNISAGAGLAFIGIVILILLFATGFFGPKTQGDEAFGMLLIPTIIFGVGLIFLLRGILQKNTEKSQQKTT